MAAEANAAHRFVVRPGWLPILGERLGSLNALSPLQTNAPHVPPGVIGSFGKQAFLIWPAACLRLTVLRLKSSPDRVVLSDCSFCSTGVSWNTRCSIRLAERWPSPFLRGPEAYRFRIPRGRRISSGCCRSGLAPAA